MIFLTQAASALAGTSGGIAGTVTDSNTGAPLSGVTVSISSRSQSITVTTGARVHFTALSLQPNDYNLMAQKNGYDTIVTSPPR